MDALAHRWWDFPVQEILLCYKTKEILFQGGQWQHVKVLAKRWCSSSFKVILPFFQRKPCRPRVTLKKTSTEWFCNIFLPEENDPGFLGLHCFVKLPLKTFSVRYVTQNKSKTQYSTAFFLCVALHLIVLFLPIPNLHAVILM